MPERQYWNRHATIDAEIDARKHSDDGEEAGGFGHGGAKIAVSQKIHVEAEVNRARYMPQVPCAIQVV